MYTIMETQKLKLLTEQLQIIQREYVERNGIVSGADIAGQMVQQGELSLYEFINILHFINDYNSPVIFPEEYANKKAPQTFTLEFDKNWLSPNDVISFPDQSTQCIVTSEPRRSRWKRFLQFVTLGIYKAPWQFTIKPLIEDERPINDSTAGNANNL